MLLKEAPTLFPQHLKNSLLNMGLIDKEACTLSTLNTVIFRANKVWFLCWILSELPPAAATNKQIVGSVPGSILVNIPNTPLERILCRSEQLLRNGGFYNGVVKEETGIWLKGAVRKILTDERYTGKMITNTRETEEVGKPKMQSL